jgi:hypothetical protein
MCLIEEPEPCDEYDPDYMAWERSGRCAAALAPRRPARTVAETKGPTQTGF